MKKITLVTLFLTITFLMISCVSADGDDETSDAEAYLDQEITDQDNSAIVQDSGMNETEDADEASSMPDKNTEPDETEQPDTARPDYGNDTPDQTTQPDNAVDTPDVDQEPAGPALKITGTIKIFHPTYTPYDTGDANGDVTGALEIDACDTTSEMLSTDLEIPYGELEVSFSTDLILNDYPTIDTTNGVLLEPIFTGNVGAKAFPIPNSGNQSFAVRDNTQNGALMVTNDIYSGDYRESKYFLYFNLGTQTQPSENLGIGFGENDKGTFYVVETYTNNDIKCYHGIGIGEVSLEMYF